VSDEARFRDALGELVLAIEEAKGDADTLLANRLASAEAVFLNFAGRVHLALKDATADLGPKWRM
jgi:phage gp37-like protein